MNNKNHKKSIAATAVEVASNGITMETMSNALGRAIDDVKGYCEPETPESDRLVEARYDAQPVGEFLAWVYAQGLLLCRAEDCRPQGIDHRTTEQLLADWKGIDLAEVERERMALIVQLREHAEAARAVTIGLKVERCELLRGEPASGYGQVGNVVEMTDTKIRVMWLRHDGSNERRTWMARDAEGKRWQRAGATPLIG